jgi:gamma-glutamyltranspeptidase/glutathione hydrolase
MPKRLILASTALCLFLSALAPSAAFAVSAKGHAAMISGPSPYAVEVGKEVAARGGNAVDIAVAAVLSLAVTNPYFGSLGGGGFALVKSGDNGVEALDFRETAPQAAGPSFFEGKPKTASRDGALAIGVPGLPAGLWELHKKRGKLHWSQLFPRVIELASKGFEVSGEWASVTKAQSPRFNQAGTRAFLRNGSPLRPGDLLKQPALAKLLKEMSARGIVPFYQGLAATDIVDTIKALGGAIQMSDMRDYKPRWLEPLKMGYRGYEIWSMPPPSSGGLLTRSALRFFDLLKASESKALSIDEFHRIGEALKLAFRVRQALGDPSFTKNPLEEINDPAALAKEAARFRPDKAIEVEPASPGPAEKEETTHVSVLTASGDGVAITVTLNGWYGSGIVSEKYGIALNNEMDDFTTHFGEPNMFRLMQGKANQVEPGKRPLSSMSPTLATKDGKLVLAIGAPGGPRIISAVAQALYRLLALGTDLDLAIQAPRVHHQYLPNVLFVDRDRFAPETLDGLRARGHALEAGSTAKIYAARATADGILEGAFDSRGEGAAGGY